MATISKRGGRWYAQVRRRGFPSKGKSFGSQAEAKAWATIQEGRIEQGSSPFPATSLRDVPLRAIINRYLDEVTPTKRSADTEQLRLQKLSRDPLADIALADLNASHLAAYRDRRLETVKSGTIRRELSLIHHALDIARKEWGMPLGTNPVTSLRLPKLNNARDRRLREGEFEILMKAISTCRGDQLASIVQLAIHTGMRRGEILDLAWDRIDLAKRLAHIPHTKTGKPRTIPLTDDTIDILMAMPGRSGPVFTISPNALKLSWQRAVRRSGLSDFRFHDLRHEAVSRFFEIGLAMPEVALISGHRDPRMLFRYTHIAPTRLAQKLQGTRWTLAS